MNIINASQAAFPEQVVKVGVCKYFVEELAENILVAILFRVFYGAKRLLLVAKSFV